MRSQGQPPDNKTPDARNRVRVVVVVVVAGVAGVAAFASALTPIKIASALHAFDLLGAKKKKKQNPE